MTFQLIAFGTLEIKVIQSITSEVEAKGLNAQDLPFAVIRLPDERRIQSDFLLKVIQTLKSSINAKFHEDQAQILNAAVYLVRDKIKASYGVTSPTNSHLYNSLSSSLDLTKANSPDHSDLFKMYGFLERFLRANIYVTKDKVCDPENGYLATRPFDGILGYDVTDDILFLSEKLLQYKKEKIIKYQAIFKRKPQDVVQTNSGSGRNGLFPSASSSNTTTTTTATSTETATPK
ncbi:MAG: hypothetical protein ACHP6H_03615 [Legionellales bacterium]